MTSTGTGNVLVLSAHPDDEVLGCGGTIAGLAGNGDRVHIAILGEGMTSRFSDRESVDPSDLAALHGASREAAEILGAVECRQFGFPDNRFDTVPLLEVVKVVESLIEELRPRVVFTQHGGDLNVDHQVLYRATLTATRPMVGGCVQDVYAYEVGSSTEWAFQRFSPVFSPCVFVDIAATLDKKLRAMEVYESEARSFPHPRSTRALRAQAERWGATAGLAAAEAFELVRSVRVPGRI